MDTSISNKKHYLHHNWFLMITNHFSPLTSRAKNTNHVNWDWISSRFATIVKILHINCLWLSSYCKSSLLAREDSAAKTFIHLTYLEICIFLRLRFELNYLLAQVLCFACFTSFNRLNVVWKLKSKSMSISSRHIKSNANSKDSCATNEVFLPSLLNEDVL